MHRAILLLLLISSAAPLTADELARPNIILCMTDDQGWGDVSYNGLTKIKTPNMDAMAAAGLRFNRFYAQQTCSPTRASVLEFGVVWVVTALRIAESRASRQPHVILQSNS